MRTTIFAAAAAAAVAVIATTTFADAAPKAAGTTTTIKTTMNLTAVTNVDADRNGGPSAGDFELFSEVHHSASGAVVGNGTAVCFETDGAGKQFTCSGETDFGASQLQEAFHFFPASNTFRAAILGGTGKYQGAYGEMTGTWLDAKESKASVVFTIKIP